MKKHYEELEVEIIVFNASDVIVTSTGTDSSTTENIDDGDGD